MRRRRSKPADYPKYQAFYGQTQCRTKGPHKMLRAHGRVCDTSSVGNFSAVAYYFGRRLHKTLNVPIGLINTSWGGTPAEAWTSLPALQVIPGVMRRWANAGQNTSPLIQKHGRNTRPSSPYGRQIPIACALWGNAVREDRGEIRIVPIVRLCSTMG